jgi:hypothetical protein
MLKRITAHFDDMVLAIAVWMCRLPLVGLLVIPLLGLKAGLVVAAMLFIVIMIICQGICGWKIFRK